ncbi:MAG TPA: DUF1016 N-terminal domain-containing protein, partial [bacterium]|nr:DUF1016 N-terminal domain-containing protein [bacterium]
MNEIEVKLGQDYKNWLTALKLRIRTVQLKAAVAVNTELLTFYWELGQDIVNKQKTSAWGDGFLKQLSVDLTSEFPEMKGFSISNIKYIKQWHLFYSKPDEKSQQPVGQITQIPWGHNIAIISKCKNISEALYYAQQTTENSWSRSVLIHQIESGLYQREGKSINNFSA